jgi:hypothetical protein
MVSRWRTDVVARLRHRVVRISAETDMQGLFSALASMAEAICTRL